MTQEPLTEDEALVKHAQAAARQIEIDIAVKAREALIAEWLRKYGMRQVALFIENEEHLK